MTDTRIPFAPNRAPNRDVVGLEPSNKIHHMDGNMHTKSSNKLTHEGAKAISDAGAKKASEMNLPICIAVVDEGGHLLAFARIDDCKPSSVDVSITKAVAAATRRSPSGPVPNADNANIVLSVGLVLASHGTLTCVRGGLPIEWQGSVIGAIGVSGGTEAQDEEVARAGLTALANFK